MNPYTKSQPPTLCQSLDTGLDSLYPVVSDKMFILYQILFQPIMQMAPIMQVHTFACNV